MNLPLTLAQAAAGATKSAAAAPIPAPAPAAAATATATAGSSNVFSAAYWFGSAGASSQAKETEALFMYILWVNIISFVLLMILVIWFAYKYHRSKQAANYQVSVAHNTPLELAWSIIPLLVMVPIFYYGLTGYISKLAAPSDSEVINIYGQKWSWRAVYRNGAEPRDQARLTRVEYDVPEIIVPAGRPVKLIMTSDDVLHAFFIPDFRTKMDVIPNRYTSMWFLPEPLSPGKAAPIYKVFCAEYCGEKHSEMAAQIRVVTPKEFDESIAKWADVDPKWTLLEYGQRLYKSKNCVSCHSLDGSKNTGPSWKNYFGYEHSYKDGSKHVADENWLTENILNSQKVILNDYDTSMPVFEGKLRPLQVQALILYMKTLSDKSNPADTTAAEAAYAKLKEEAAKAAATKK